MSAASETLPSRVRIGEVVEASVDSLIAEVPPDALYSGPAFGSLVRAESVDGCVYAVVAASVTGSLEAARRTTAFWQDEQELRQTQPQIFELLSTRFTALTVGCEDAGQLHLRLPSRPARVHGFVYACSDLELQRLSADPVFVEILLDAPLAHPDELIAAALRQAAPLQPDDYLRRAGKTLALLLGAEYPRLQRIVRKLSAA